MSHEKKLSVPLALLAGFALGTNPQFRLFGFGGYEPPREEDRQSPTARAALQPTDFHGRMGAESPELRVLRMAELEMFAPDPVESALKPRPVDPADQDCVTSSCDEVREPRDRMSFFGDGLDEEDFLEGLERPEIPVARRAQIQKYIEYFSSEAKGRKMFTAWLRRSGKYEPIVNQALSKRKLPKDLAAVAFIESGWWPTAKSSAGAMGLWQFMPQTARAYGLTVSDVYDERMSIWKSTAAAVEHLDDLHTRFQSWELALAAYNMGYQGLERRVREHGTDNFWELAELGALPRETRLYVPKVLAVAVLLRNLRFFGFGSVERMEGIDAVALDVPPAVPLATLARAAGTSVRVLRELNPELRGKTTPDHGSEITVRIPSRGLSRAKVMLPQLLGPDHDVRVSVSEDFDWGRDDLGDDGRSRLERTNPALSLAPGGEPSSKKDEPSALLPSPGALASPAPAKPAAKLHKLQVSEVAAESAPATSSTSPFDGTQLLYKVRRGDTLGKIAWHFGYRYPELAKQNALRDPSYVRSGQLLTIQSPKRITDRVRGGLYYRIQEGDTLDSIRRRSGLEPVASKGRALHPDALKVGELLRVRPSSSIEDG